MTPNRIAALIAIGAATAHDVREVKRPANVEDYGEIANAVANALERMIDDTKAKGVCTADVPDEIQTHYSYFEGFMDAIRKVEEAVTDIPEDAAEASLDGLAWKLLGEVPCTPTFDGFYKKRMFLELLVEATRVLVDPDGTFEWTQQLIFAAMDSCLA